MLKNSPANYKELNSSPHPYSLPLLKVGKLTLLNVVFNARLRKYLDLSENHLCV